jgi:AmpD protein
VAAHCVIWRDGTIFQYVPFANRAWHAGQSEFAGRANCNDFSIGIELEGSDNIPYTEAQYQSLIALSHYLLGRYKDIRPERIVGHCDIAPGRKTDPGPAFDWSLYRGAIQAAIKESRE